MLFSELTLTVIYCFGLIILFVAITLVFKQFPRIGMSEVGLDKLAAHVCTLVANNVNEALKKALESKNNTMYVDCLILLFETVARMIDRQQAMVEYYYGPGSMASVLVRLSRESDVQSCLLINSLAEARQLERKVKEIKKWQDVHRRSKGASAPPPIDIELREIDTILGGLYID